MRNKIVHYRIYTKETTTGMKTLCGRQIGVNGSSKNEEIVTCPACGRKIKRYLQKKEQMLARR